jgi:hypothetical protein
MPGNVFNPGSSCGGYTRNPKPQPLPGPARSAGLIAAFASVVLPMQDKLEHRIVSPLLDLVGIELKK